MTSRFALRRPAFQRKALLTLLVATSGVLPHAALATDLADVLAAARENDPEYAAAMQTWNADQQYASQGRAALLPTITAKYSHMKNDRTLEPSDEKQKYDQQTTTVSLVQPLFNPESWYSYSQGKAQASVGEAQFAQAEQEFLLRVATKYTDVLRTWDKLLAAQAAEKAFSRQLDQTRERFNVGLVPITDLHEAQAAYDLGQVQLIVAQSDFSVARNNLIAFTGQDMDSIDGLSADAPYDGPNPADPEAWVQRAQEANPGLLTARAQADTAKATSKQGLSRQLPSVDLVGQYQHTHYQEKDGNLASSFLGQDSNGNAIGIEVTVPIFTGGALNSQRLQSSYQYQASEELYRLTWRNVTQNARSLTQVVAADAQRVKARKQALVSAESVLKATRSGYEVGTRNAVDLLEAQQRLFSSQSDYAEARYDYILDSLRLQALGGMLDEAVLLKVDQWLTPTVAVNLNPVDSTSPEATQSAEGQNAATP